MVEIDFYDDFTIIPENNEKEMGINLNRNPEEEFQKFILTNISLDDTTKMIFLCKRKNEVRVRSILDPYGLGLTELVFYD